MSYKALILHLQLDIFDEKGVTRVKGEKFRFPVDVRGSKTVFELKLSICFRKSSCETLFYCFESVYVRVAGV